MIPHFQARIITGGLSDRSGPSGTRTRFGAEEEALQPASGVRLVAPRKMPEMLWLARPLVRLERFAESFEQGAVDRVALRVVLRVPLYADCKTLGIGNADRLDGAVFRHALDEDAFARFEDILP